jgi:hypothetical protein
VRPYAGQFGRYRKGQSCFDCDKPVLARHLCSAHYNRLWRRGELDTPYPTLKRVRICDIDGCGKKHMARGWCSAHYERWRLYGDPLRYKNGYERVRSEDDFWDQVDSFRKERISV